LVPDHGFHRDEFQVHIGSVFMVRIPLVVLLLFLMVGGSSCLRAIEYFAPGRHGRGSRTDDGVAAFAELAQDAAAEVLAGELDPRQMAPVLRVGEADLAREARPADALAVRLDHDHVYGLLLAGAVGLGDRRVLGDRFARCGVPDRLGLGVGGLLGDAAGAAAGQEEKLNNLYRWGIVV
jgi:hypothetical protein